MREAPVASIIVPTHNRATSLAITLRSLVAQRIRTGYELLILDNGSTDETRIVAQEAIAANPQQMIQYLEEPIPGLLSGRHRGALEARSDLFIFVDDDIEADPGWLEAFVDSFEDPTVELVGGPSLPNYERPPPDWLTGFWTSTPYGGRLCAWLSLLDLGDRHMVVDPTFVLGLNFGIRRSALFTAGGFHPDCIPDNLQHWQGDGEAGLTLNARKLGFRAVYQPRALVRHRIPASRLSAEYFERRGYYQGVCDSYSEIRAAAYASLAAATSAETFPRSPSRLMQYAKAPVRYARSLVRRARSSLVENREVVEIRQRVERAYDAGFAFHQSAARRHPEVLEWVLRKDYWDYRVPELSRALENE
jgi:glucosyl-dolichyl phosphate glucuronosyltransferase